MEEKYKVMDVSESCEAIEQKALAKALERNGGNKQRAAEELGISFRHFCAKAKKYGLITKNKK